MISQSPKLPSVLVLPNFLIFPSLESVQILSLINSSQETLVFKIKTNNRSALSIQLSHGFLEPQKVREISVKLVEKAASITKLEISYAIATNKMIEENDSKLSLGSVKKELLRKFVIEVKMERAGDQTLKKSVGGSDGFGRVFRYDSVQLGMGGEKSLQKTALSPFREKSTIPVIQHIPQPLIPPKTDLVQYPPQQFSSQPSSFFTRVRSQQIELVQHPDQQDQDELCQRIKKGKENLKKLKEEVLEDKLAKLKNTKFNDYVVFGGMIGCFLVGGMLKSLVNRNDQ